MAKSQASLNQTASRLARWTLSPTDAPTDIVDLSAEAVALIEAQRAYETNINVAKTMDEMTSSTLSLIG
jgi:flagellar hook protein FlgE